MRKRPGSAEIGVVHGGGQTADELRLESRFVNKSRAQAEDVECGKVRVRLQIQGAITMTAKSGCFTFLKQNVEEERLSRCIFV
ncbi:hypothetical protein RHMOL_Rhmol03G0031600 [Rhododendron molle]|uniref:Uncharacterized protein n=1 Tax=Rhododendron molle TaxID=49168 RepID=A0ACC0PB42_RHOML|nr:hypothetical protein RHMOL_Rhmol03G0031600 [Rhododendron molle]